MHKQRIWVASIAAFGLCTLFLPWLNINVLIPIGISGTDVPQGWLVAIIFGAAIAVTVSGSRAYALDGARQGILAVLGLAAIGFAIWKYKEISDGSIDLGEQMGGGMRSAGGETAGELGREMGRGMSKMMNFSIEIGFGLYAIIVAGVAMIIAAFAKKRAA